MIKVTWHALCRFEERFKVDTALAYHICNKALNEGVDVLHEEPFKHEMRKAARFHRTDAVYRYKQYLVFFCEERVVTVWPLDWLRS